MESPLHHAAPVIQGLSMGLRGRGSPEGLVTIIRLLQAVPLLYGGCPAGHQTGVRAATGPRSPGGLSQTSEKPACSPL